MKSLIYRRNSGITHERHRKTCPVLAATGPEPVHPVDFPETFFLVALCIPFDSLSGVAPQFLKFEMGGSVKDSITPSDSGKFKRNWT